MTISSTDKRNYMSTLMGLLWALLHALLVDPTALRIPPSAPLCWKDKKKQKSMRLGLCVWRVLFRVSSASLLPSPNPTIFFFFIIIFFKVVQLKKTCYTSQGLQTAQHLAILLHPCLFLCTHSCLCWSAFSSHCLYSLHLSKPFWRCTSASVWSFSGFFFFLLCSFSFFVCLEYKNNRLHPPPSELILLVTINVSKSALKKSEEL